MMPARLAVLSLCLAHTLAAQSRAAGEVRQLVTFLFQPGMADSARGIYRRELLPAYTADTAMRRFRAYREAESPEPLDMVFVSSFAGMAGMDDSNAALRQLASGGRSVFAWYGALSAIAMHHRDDFVEMIPSLARGRQDGDAQLVVLEYLRLVPGGHRTWEQLVAGGPTAATWREVGRVLVGDGWDYVRFHGIRRLADWQAQVAAERAGPAGNRLGRLVVARKVVILREDPVLSVR